MKLSILKSAPDYRELGQEQQVGQTWKPDAESARIMGMAAFTHLEGGHSAPTRVWAFGTTWTFWREVWVDKVRGIYGHSEYTCDRYDDIDWPALLKVAAERGDKPSRAGYLYGLAVPEGIR